MKKEYTNSDYIVSYSNCIRTNQDCSTCFASWNNLQDLCIRIKKEIKENAKKTKTK